MELEKFIKKNPFLYHLTSKANAENIIKQKELFSANHLITMSKDQDLIKNSRNKRKAHVFFNVDGIEISLRDQQPISMVALPKCLSDGWKVEDFLHHLNDRVFMWPTLKRLEAHYNRYASENPVIFRFSTAEILNINPHVKFSRLNSGATRANSHLGGKAPERGPKTFLPADEFNLSVSNVAEVTFENQCKISGIYSFSDSPHGYFKNCD